MKNSISTFILMIGLLVTMAIGHQVMASISSHPELVSGPPQQVASASHPELVSASYPETTISASVSSSIEATVGDPTVTDTKGNFFTNNWGALLIGLLGFADMVARLTPTEKDNSIINFLITILNAIIPNLKKGGGTFNLQSQ